jgi:hypothetical protein
MSNVPKYFGFLFSVSYLLKNWQSLVVAIQGIFIITTIAVYNSDVSESYGFPIPFPDFFPYRQSLVVIIRVPSVSVRMAKKKLGGYWRHHLQEIFRVSQFQISPRNKKQSNNFSLSPFLLLSLSLVKRHFEVRKKKILHLGKWVSINVLTY